MRGSTKKIQYGIPASCSAPMEPYLKRISGVAVTQSGCGSSRKNLYQPMAPTTTARTTTSSKQLFHQDFFFGASAIVPPSVTLVRANCPTKRFRDTRRERPFPRSTTPCRSVFLRALYWNCRVLPYHKESICGHFPLRRRKRIRPFPGRKRRSRGKRFSGAERWGRASHATSAPNHCEDKEPGARRHRAGCWRNRRSCGNG